MKAIDWATWRAVLLKLKWLAFCIIRGPVFIGRPYATLKTPIFAHCFGWT
jgi:hypothetical protein